MAKKKKHRKTRKQKNAQRKNISTNPQTAKKEVVEGTKLSKESKSAKPYTKSSPTQQEDMAVRYFRHDVRRSFTLIVGILLVFGVLYLLLDKTSIGTQVYSIIKF